jgi:hypothetical protein
MSLFRRSRRHGMMGALVALGAVSGCASPEAPSGSTASSDPPAGSTASSDPPAGDGSIAADPLIAVAGTEYTLAWSPDQGASTLDITIADRNGVTTPLLTGIADTGSATVRFPLLAPSADALDLEVLDPRSGRHRVDAGVRPAALAEFVWNPDTEVEEYRWLDPATGRTTLRGTVGDLRWWYGMVAFDAELHRIYVAGYGEDPATDPKLYTLDARSGRLLSAVRLDLPAFAPFVVNGPASVLGFVLSPVGFTVMHLDPSTGHATPLTTVSASMNWGPDAVLDLARRRVYLVGYPVSGEGPPTVYAIDTSTGVLVASTPIQWSGSFILGFTAGVGGKLVGFAWNGSAEQMLSIDPSTGAVTPLGIVGDLLWWNGLTAFNASTRPVLVFGSSPDGDPRLSAMDVTSGQLRHRVRLSVSPSKALVVN